MRVVHRKRGLWLVGCREFVGELFIGGVGSGCRDSSSAWWSRSVGLVQGWSSWFEVVVLLVLLRVGCAVGGSKGRTGSELSCFGLCSASWPHLGSAGSTWKATHLREGSVFRLTSTWSGA